MLQGNPCAPTECASQVCQRRIGCDDQIKALHERSGVEKGVRAVVEGRRRHFNLHVGRQSRQLLETLTLLQADEPHTR